MKAANTYDVARIAGVSQATVSRVINGSDKVSEKTKYKVNEAILQLKYKANITARSLTTNKTYLVGIIAPHTDYPYTYAILQAISNELKNKGYSGIILPYEMVDIENYTINNVSAYNLDGIISFTDIFSHQLLEECDAKKIPFVQFGRIISTENCFYVLGDSYRSGIEAAEYFIDTGETNLFYVTGEISSYIGNERRRGYFERSLEEVNVSCKEIVASFEYNKSFNCLESLPQESIRPGGYFCATDVIAYSLVDFIRTHTNYEIPRDIQIIGYDDLDMSSWKNYSLSTFSQDFVGHAKVAVNLLYESMEGNEVYSKKLKLEYIDRGTTKNRL